MVDRVEGQVALITGAGRGQGRSHAIRFAEEGADVIAVDHCGDLGTIPYGLATEADLDETCKAIEAAGRRVVRCIADVRDLAALRAAVDRGVAELGRLDIVVANAGVASYASATDLTEDQWTEMIDVNLSGAWRTAKSAIPHIRAGGRGGCILMTGSVAALRGIPHGAHYVASKHGLVGLVKVLALELGPESIRVNAIHPTNVNTGMIQNDATLELFLPNPNTPRTEEAFARVAQTLNVLPVPWVEPRVISDMMLFLASDEGRFISGASIPVDAGMSQRW